MRVSGTWTHSFEEDEADVQVFRPTASYPFPPARRGRERLRFEDDQVIVSTPGPDDRSVPTAQWHSVGEGWYASAAVSLDDNAPADVEVVEASDDVLKIRRS